MLDNVTITGSGRYGLKVKGSANICNTVHPGHALSISNCADNAIDIENGGEVISSFSNVPADTYAIRLFDNAKKNINVRNGGNANLESVDESTGTA